MSVGIDGFKRVAAERLFNRGDARGINPARVGRVLGILEALDGPNPLRALSVPSYRLHPLKGDRKGEWRVTFRADGASAWDVRYENYQH